jgi:Na+-transporting NADH:ubiquinone oxidoreductase subunit NqrB
VVDFFQQSTTNSRAIQFSPGTQENDVNASARIHWIRILLGGFLAEVSVFVVVIPAYKIFGARGLTWSALLGSLVMCFLFALWVGRGVDTRFVLHGALVGVVASLLYVGLTLAKPEPLAYIVAHVLKILGGAAGGVIASRQRLQAATGTPR